MRLISMVIIVSIFLTITGLLWNMPQNADAAFGPFFNLNTGTTSITADPGTISLGGTTKVIICTGNTPRDVMPLSLISPSGILYQGKLEVFEVFANQCFGFDIGGTSSDFVGVTSLSEPGNWVATFKDMQNGNEFTVDFGVSFFVIPESAIGAIALTGTSLAVLGGYVLIAKKRK